MKVGVDRFWGQRNASWRFPGDKKVAQESSNASETHVSEEKRSPDLIGVVYQ